ncbi:uncharacterized protein [Coffea arabica]|uniref:Reverse transcriptase domain-containing protein n=1 Tax=Coffea arabica TaxID=13443 RepID=A0A6P6TGC7_COFAR|nr:uncharacterized protein LOC113700860 [Coffea arabica]
MDHAIFSSTGDIWIFFKASISCRKVGESNQHLSLQIDSALFAVPIIFSFVHAKCTALQRVELWDSLLADKPTQSAWLLVGDFNVIVSEEEKRGGVPFTPEEGWELLNFMSQAGIFDVGYSGSIFTWCNNRYGRARIWKRLDRLLMNQVSSNLGLGFDVQHLCRDPSDHAPLLLSAHTKLDNKPKPFRFLNFWTSKPELLDVVRCNWIGNFSGPPLKVLAAKLRNVKMALRMWSREVFGDIFEAVKVAEQRALNAEVSYDADPSQPNLVLLHEAQAQLRRSHATENMFWQQKSRIKWLKDGDRNSKYFHSVVVERQSRSLIHRIKSSDGKWLDSTSDIEGEAESYFKCLFTDESYAQSFETLEVIPRLISSHDNVMLEKIPSKEEVKLVVFSMDGDSAAGPDGFSGKFFTFAWDIVAEDVYAAVISFFCGEVLPRSISSTSIVLIPKLQSPQDFTQFRPISLCNFINKVISKILSDRLSRLLPKIISPQQSGFVRGRHISDNFLLAQELISGIRQPNQGGNVVLKLDMAKAYDRVSWIFLLQVLRRFGFSERWIDMIWRLISNVWFSVLINGSPCGFFQSTRGLRQGDPISPALFIIGAEVFSRSLNSLVGQRGFLPFKVPTSCPIVTHLAYADDVIIFCSGVKRTLKKVMSVLENYCCVSGQQLNSQKSCFVDHDALTLPRKRVISQISGFQAKSLPLRYLGCTLYSGRRKSSYFSDICTSVAKRILSWKEKLLSSGGRLVLLKNVLSSLPIHVLAATTPPKGVLRTLEKAFANFLWGTTDKGSRYHWIAWDSLCKPYAEGGVGVRALTDVFNAFSLKLWWSLRQRQSLWAEFMYNKYLHKLHACEAEFQPLQSVTWKRLVTYQSLANSHIQWVLQNGLINFWHENWTGTGPLCQQIDIFGDHTVADFVSNGQWNIPMLRQWLPENIVSTILQIIPPDVVSNQPDRMVWDLEISGSFSFSSAYKVVRTVANTSIFSSTIWVKDLPAKISFFMMRMLSWRLPVQDVLQRFGVCGPSRCVCCQNPGFDSIDHVFCTGEIPRQVWKSFQVDIGQFVTPSTVKHAVIQWWLLPAKNIKLKLVYQLLPSLICWHLWKARNTAVWEGKVLSVMQINTFVLSDLYDIFQLHFTDIGVGRYSWPCFYSSLVSWQKPFKFILVRWIPPVLTTCKLNTDGSSLGNPGRSGGGGVLRNSSGVFLLGFACYWGVIPSLHSELKVLLFGVKLCVMRGFFCLHLESDSSLLVQMVKGISRCPWDLQRELDQLLTFRHFFQSVTHCYRQANLPADRLSKVGTELKSNIVYDSWLELPRLVRGDLKLDRLGYPNFRVY